MIRLLAAVGMLGLCLGCSAVPRQADSAAGFRAAVAELASQPNVEPGSEIEQQGINRLKSFLGNWSPATIRLETARVYAPNAYLNDTLKTLRGADAIRDYFLETVENAESLTVQFEDVTRAGDGFYYFRWVMDVRMKRIAKGEIIRTPGITLVRFDAQGRVLIHQDYWDSAAGLWEHVPGLGRGIRTIKARF
jgi:ketosteroid isomerase-like protein